MLEKITRKELLKLAFPLFLASMSDLIMTTVDTIFVGRLGVVEIGAVGLSGIFIWASYNLFKGIPICTGTFVSQNYGAKKYPNCIVSLYNGLLVVAVSAAILFLYRYLVPHLVGLMKPSENVQEIATMYIQIRMLGALWFLSNIAFASFYRGIGKTGIIFRVNIAANLLNVVLDYILVFGVMGLGGLGVKGAAIATVISQFSGTVLYLFAFYSKREKVFEGSSMRLRFDFPELKKLLDIGIPKNLAIFSEVFATFMFTVFIGRLGDAQLAASTIMLQLVILSNASALGFGGAGAAMVGQYIGAGNRAEAYKSGYHSMEMNVIFTVVFSVVLVALSTQVCSIFNTDPMVIHYFNQIVFFGILFVCFDNLQIVAQYCLAGAGDTKIPFYAMLVAAYIIYIPLAYLFAFRLELGIWGAWMAAAIFVMSYAVFVVGRFMKKSWQKIVLLSAEES